MTATTAEIAPAIAPLITPVPLEIKALTVKSRPMSLAVYKQLQRGTTEGFFDFERPAIRVRPLGWVNVHEQRRGHSPCVSSAEHHRHYVAPDLAGTLRVYTVDTYHGRLPIGPMWDKLVVRSEQFLRAYAISLLMAGDTRWTLTDKTDRYGHHPIAAYGIETTISSEERQDIIRYVKMQASDPKILHASWDLDRAKKFQERFPRQPDAYERALVDAVAARRAYLGRWMDQVQPLLDAAPQLFVAV